MSAINPQVVVIGNIGIDTNVYLPGNAIDLVHEANFTENLDTVGQAGGYASRGYARLGALTAFIGYVGADWMGEQITRIAYPAYWHYDILAGLRVMAAVDMINDLRCKAALDRLIQGSLSSWFSLRDCGTSIKLLRTGSCASSRVKRAAQSPLSSIAEERAASGTQPRSSLHLRRMGLFSR